VTANLCESKLYFAIHKLPTFRDHFSDRFLWSAWYPQ